MSSLAGMSPETFADVARTHFADEFAHFRRASLTGVSRSGTERQLWPTTLMYGSTPSHYTIELFGASTTPVDLAVQRLDHAGPTDALASFTDLRDPQCWLKCMSSPISRTPAHLARDSKDFLNMALVEDPADEAINGRYPGLPNRYASHIQLRMAQLGKDFTPLAIDASAGAILVANCVLGSRRGTTTRLKHTNLFAALPKEFTSTKQVWLSLLGAWQGERMRPEPLGCLVLTPEAQQAAVTASQLSAFVMQPIHEPKITDFLEAHRGALARMLRATELHFQPYLKWIQTPDCKPRTAIVPDLVYRDHIGRWCILDFKLPLLNEKSVVTKSVSRPQFKFTVRDGIAQLAGYRQYFTNDANRNHAATVFNGQQIRDPRLLLVVGSSENVRADEVDQALLSHTDVTIIDYESLFTALWDDTT